MDDLPTSDALLIRKIKDGDEESWKSLIEKFEGRLYAFASRRLQDAAAVDDVIQETLLGFHLSLPNYDEGRSLESYLFAICSYKIADNLRKLGKRSSAEDASSATKFEERVFEVPDRKRMVSSIHRSNEQKSRERESIQLLLKADVQKWKQNHDWQKLACIELVFASELSNKAIAEKLGLSEQKVANYKSDYLIRMKTQIAKI